MLRPVRRCHGDAGELSRAAGGDARSFAVHGLPNPDIVVERGDTLLYCAGALADAYVELGGEALYCGKPHAPIYEVALGKAAACRGGEVPPRSRVLAIGDSIRTDLQGAASFGVDCLFVTSGIHAEEFGGREAPDLSGVNTMFAAAGVAPKALTRKLEW